MPPESEPLESTPKPAARAPEPAPAPAPAPAMAPPVTDALFSTGLGAGVGAASGVTLTRHLARRPAEDRKAAIDDLNERVGNRRVTRMLRADAAVVARLTGDEDLAARADTGSDADKIRRGVDERDADLLKSVSSWAEADGKDRLAAIDIILEEQLWIGPMDEYALESIWNSYGDGLAKVASDNIGLWDKCLRYGMDPSGIPAVEKLRSAFENDVKAMARNYMARNLEYADEQMSRLGITKAEGPQSPTAELEQSLALEEVQELARGAEELLKAQDAMRGILVGYTFVNNPSAGGLTQPVYFTPNPSFGQRPVTSEPSIYQKNHPKAKYSWEDVKKQWDESENALAAITAQNPTVFAAVASGRDEVKSLAGDDPRTAKQTATAVLQTLRKNIVATMPKVDSGDLDWRDLQPIHGQLYSGRTPGPSGTSWSEAFSRSVAQDVIGDHETTEFWINLGLGSAAAALFIVAEIATAGLATPALIGGLAVGGAQAVRSWENWEDLSTAAAGTASEETRLIAGGQVTAALIQAVLDSIFLALDLGQAVTIGRGISTGLRLEAALTANSAEAALEAGLKEGGEAAVKAIERSIAELGVEATMRKTGKSIDELAALLPAGSPHLKRLEEARGFLPQTAEVLSGGEARIALTTGNAAEEAWKAGRSLDELLTELPGVVKDGTITREFADKVASEAVERLGPTAVLKRCGGWRKLQQTLGNKSAAGAKLMEWRSSVFADLEKYVTAELKGQVQRTGTVKEFSNDIDMSFIGANAAEVKDAASKYLARRLGVENSPGAFDKIMMAGLFTDPRRMHIYDALPAAVRESIAVRQAAKEEALIWNRRLWEATHEGNEELAKQIRREMSGMGVAEFAYKPLSGGDVARLARRIDSLHAELEEAAKAGDTARQTALAGEIGDAQALINASEGGGYFSGGGVRRWVSERPGEKPFPRLPGSESAAVPDVEKLTSLIDQLPKLDHSLLQLSGGAEEVLNGIRGIGKYGKRLFEISDEAGGFADGAWKSLAERCAKLKTAADTGGSSLAKGEVDKLVADARALFGELTAKSSETLAQIRAGANLPEIGNAMEAIVEMTTKHVRLLRATEWALKHIGTLGRAVQAGVRLSDYPGGQAAGTGSPNPPVAPPEPN